MAGDVSTSDQPVSTYKRSDILGKLTLGTCQGWGRLVRVVAVEDGQEYLGEPVDPDVDGRSRQSSSSIATADT